MSTLSQLIQVTRIRDFWMLVLAIVTLGTAFSLTHPYLSLFALTEVHMTSWQFGAYIVISSISGIVASMLLGKFSDRGVDRKRLILLSVVAAAVTYAILSQARSFAVVLATAVFLMSIGWAAYSQIFAFVRAKFEQEHSGDLTLATNIVRMFFSFSWVLGPVLGAFIMARYHFGPLFIVASIIFVLSGLLVLPIRIAPTAPATVEKTAVLPYLREKHIFASVAGFTFISMAHNLALMTFPVYIVETLSGDKAHIGYVFGLAAAFEIPLMILAAGVARRMPMSRLMWIGAVLSATYFGYVSLVEHPWQIYPMQVVSAAVVSIFMGIGISYFQNMLPGVPGVATALYASAFTVGSIVSGVLFAGVAAGFGYRGVFVTCALLAAIAALFLFFSSQKPRPDIVP